MLCTLTSYHTAFHLVQQKPFSIKLIRQYQGLLQSQIGSWTSVLTSCHLLKRMKSFSKVEVLNCSS